MNVLIVCLFHPHTLPTTTFVKQNKNQLLEKNDHEPGYQVLIEVYDAYYSAFVLLLQRVDNKSSQTSTSHRKITL